MTETRFDGFIFVTSCRLVKSVHQNLGTPATRQQDIQFLQTSVFHWLPGSK